MENPINEKNNDEILAMGEWGGVLQIAGFVELSKMKDYKISPIKKLERLFETTQDLSGNIVELNLGYETKDDLNEVFFGMGIKMMIQSL